MRPVSLITALLLFVAIFNLSYGYYTFLRLVVTFSSLAIVVKDYEVRNDFWCIVFVLIALLFNPLVPVHLYKKSTWVPFDVVCGLLFLVKASVPLRASK
jgi:uncharacterized protein DUF6804